MIQGITQASQSISYNDMAAQQQELGAGNSRGPGSRKHFIVYRRRRHQHNVEQRSHVDQSETPESAHMSASDVIRRLQNQLQQVSGIHIYMQPVQDITVDDRVSRTQYQYTLEDPDTDELNEWTGKFVGELKKLPALEDVATDQQMGARAISLEIDRVTASRLGIAPTTIDNTLYDAFGQREINTLYTQLNQYHVILETAPEWQQNPAKLGELIYSMERIFRSQRHRRGNVFFRFSFGVGRLQCAYNVGQIYAVFGRPHEAGLGNWRRTSSGGSPQNGGTTAGRTPNTATNATSANADPPERVHPGFAHHRSALNQPPGAVPFSHGFVQSGASRIPGNGNHATSTKWPRS